MDISATNQILLTQNQIDTKFLVVSSLDKNNNENGNFTQPLNNNVFVNDPDLFSIYPNPIINQFKISGTEGLDITEVELYDLSGKLVWNQKYDSSPGDIVVNPSTLTSGLYIGRIIKSDSSSTSFRIVKE